jgi:hypothetical protein
MKVINTYSFKGGEKYIKENHPKELDDILDAINNLSATAVLTKKSEEKTMKGKLLFSPRAMNDSLKLYLHAKGWTKAAEGKKRPSLNLVTSLETGDLGKWTA